MKIKEIKKKFSTKEKIANLITKSKMNVKDVRVLSEIIVQNENTRLETSEKKTTTLLSAIGILSALLVGASKFILDILTTQSIIESFVVVSLYISSFILMFFSLFRAIQVFDKENFVEYTSFDLIKDLDKKNNILKEYVSLILVGSLSNYDITNKKVTNFTKAIKWFKYSLIPLITLGLFIGIILLLDVIVPVVIKCFS